MMKTGGGVRLRRRASSVFHIPAALSGFFLLFSLAQEEWMIQGLPCLLLHCEGMQVT